jgi:hypothetical protein
MISVVFMMVPFCLNPGPDMGPRVDRFLAAAKFVPAVQAGQPRHVNGQFAAAATLSHGLILRN